MEGVVAIPRSQEVIDDLDDGVIEFGSSIHGVSTKKGPVLRLGTEVAGLVCFWGQYPRFYPHPQIDCNSRLAKNLPNFVWCVG